MNRVKLLSVLLSFVCTVTVLAGFSDKYKRELPSWLTFASMEGDREVGCECEDSGDCGPCESCVTGECKSDCPPGETCIGFGGGSGWECSDMPYTACSGTHEAAFSFASCIEKYDTCEHQIDESDCEGCKVECTCNCMDMLDDCTGWNCAVPGSFDTCISACESWTIYCDESVGGPNNRSDALCRSPWFEGFVSMTDCYTCGDDVEQTCMDGCSGNFDKLCVYCYDNCYYDCSQRGNYCAWTWQKEQDCFDGCGDAFDWCEVYNPCP